MTNTSEWVPSVRMEGDWNEAFVNRDCYDENYYWTEAGTGEKRFSWLFTIPRAGLYAVDGWWCTRPDSTAAAIYRVNHAGGTTAVAINQRENGGQWNRLGEYYFEPGDYSVDLSDDIPSGVVAADAVRVNHVENPPEVLQANFYGSRYKSESLTYYYFVDQSTGLYTNHLWTFGDGTTNNTRDRVLHEYTEPGEYTVSLTVSGESGTSTVRREKYAFVGDDESQDGVRVDYRARNRDGKVPLSVRFIDQSFGDFRQWRWDFGDGSPPAYEQNPVHLYERPGNYTVTLTAVDGFGRLISERKENLVRAVVFEKTIDNMDYPKTHDRGEAHFFWEEDGDRRGRSSGSPVSSITAAIRKLLLGTFTGA